MPSAGPCDMAKKGRPLWMSDYELGVICGNHKFRKGFLQNEHKV